jgi:NCS1 family nucleobase:cation symporter-1
MRTFSAVADPSATGEIRELTEDVSASPYYNEDNAPVNRLGRKWGTFDMAALWISMCACVPTYMLASGMISVGMNWWQAVGTITLANFIVLIPMVLNAHAGTRYGISFPVYCRASFGIRGANIPAMLRALVACGWFGIQTWIGGAAIFKIASVFVPSLNDWSNIPGLGINGAQLICFLIFWGINMVVVYLGIESIRVLLNIKAPLLIFLGLALLGWAIWRAHGLGPMLSQPSAFAVGQPKHGQFFPIFIASLTGNIGFWATLSLNIPDFSRYARTQKAQAVGQAVGLPTTMALYSFIGVAVTSATIVIFGHAIWDPVDLLVKLQNPVVLIIAMVSLCIATLATNLAANVVSPANDFSNLAPRFIGFRTGGFITGIVGILIQPWRLMADPNLFIFTWLGGYSSLLGAIGGVLIVDYVLIRRGNLNLPRLYERDGVYWYTAGFNPIAMVSLLIGIGLCVPGFLGRINVCHVSDFWMTLYDYAWFISFGAAGICYGVGSMLLAQSNEE